MTPQEALEKAVVASIQNDLGWTGASSFVARTFDGEPHPRCGQIFVSVWSDNSQGSHSRDMLERDFKVFVTVTVRLSFPPDRWIEHRDDLSDRTERIIGLIHKDLSAYAVSNAAAVFYTPDDAGHFIEALGFVGADAIKTVGPDWFKAVPESGQCGIAQTLRFGGNRRKELFGELPVSVA